jgi:hypothetical protein
MPNAMINWAGMRMGSSSFPLILTQNILTNNARSFFGIVNRLNGAGALGFGDQKRVIDDFREELPLRSDSFAPLIQFACVSRQVQVNVTTSESE